MTATARARALSPTAQHIQLPSSLIVGNRQTLKLQVLDALDAGARQIVLDFRGTAYIDSSGLGVLVSVNKSCRDRGAELVLAGLNTELRALFELYQLHQLFRIEDGDR